MWLAGPTTDEVDEWAAELETGVGGWHQVPPEAAASAAPAPDDVEERLGAVAAEEGWDEAEVEAIRAYLAGTATPASPDTTPQPARQEPSRAPAELEFPGSDELEQAMSALAEPPPSIETDALPPEWRDVEPAWPDESAQPGESAGEPQAPAPEPERKPEPDPQPEPDLSPVPGEPEWLRGRQDAAARAYRRLRRIFPAPDER